MARFNFFYRVRNLIRWLPTIWKDSHHDFYYINQILIKKLEFTRDFFLSDDAVTESSKETAKEIDEVIQKLKKTGDCYENYESPVHRDIEKKWGEVVCSFYKNSKGNYEGLFDIHIHNRLVNTNEDRRKFNQEFYSKLKEANDQCLKDRIEAYTLLAKRIEYWWD